MIFTTIAVIACAAALYRTCRNYYYLNPGRLRDDLDWLKIASGVSGVTNHRP